MEVDGLQDHNDFDKVSNSVIDMLLDSTLKKHGVKLETEKINEKQKEELRTMVARLKKSVDQMSQTKTNKTE